jgi:hypothetical protein
MYIPGETRQNEKTRKVFIENGVLFTFLTIFKDNSDPELT